MADSLFDNRYRYDYIYPRGRSGETLRAVDTTDGNRPVVVKRPYPNDAPPVRAGQEASIQNESKALKRLKGHPVLTELIDEGKFVVGASSHQYIVLERADGTIIEDRVLSLGAQGKRIPTLELLVIVDHLLSLLSAAHENNVIYNDVDAKHLFWNQDAQSLKVIDWGNAVILDDSKSSPQGISKQTDIFQVGELLYFLLTGGARPNINRSADEEFRLDFGEFDQTISRELKEIISKALNPNLGERYESILSLRSDLSQFRKPLEQKRNEIIENVSHKLQAANLSKTEVNNLLAELEPAFNADPSYPPARRIYKRLNNQLRQLEASAEQDALRIYLQSGRWESALQLLRELTEDEYSNNYIINKLLLDCCLIILDSEAEQTPPVVQDAMIMILDGDVGTAARQLLATNPANLEVRSLQWNLAERISVQVPEIQLIRPSLYRLVKALRQLQSQGVSAVEPRAILDEVNDLLSQIAGQSPVNLIKLRDYFAVIVDQLTALNPILQTMMMQYELTETQLPLSALDQVLTAAMALADNMHIIGKHAVSNPGDALAAIDNSRAIDPANPIWDEIERFLNNLYELLQASQTYVPNMDGSDLHGWLVNSQRKLRAFETSLFDEMLTEFYHGLVAAEQSWSTFCETAILGNRTASGTALAEAAHSVSILSPSLAQWLNQLRDVVNSTPYLERHSVPSAFGRTLAKGWEAFDRGELEEAEQLGLQTMRQADNETELSVATRLRDTAKIINQWLDNDGIRDADVTSETLNAVEELYTPEEAKIVRDFSKQMPSTETYLKAMGKALIRVFDETSTRANRILFIQYILSGALDAHENRIEDAQFWYTAALNAISIDGLQRDHPLLQVLREFIQQQEALYDAQNLFESVTDPQSLTDIELIITKLNSNPHAASLEAGINSLTTLRAAVTEWSQGDFSSAQKSLESAIDLIHEIDEAGKIRTPKYENWLTELENTAEQLASQQEAVEELVQASSDEQDLELYALLQSQVKTSEGKIGSQYSRNLQDWFVSYQILRDTYNDAHFSKSEKLARFDEYMNRNQAELSPVFPLFQHWKTAIEEQEETPEIAEEELKEDDTQPIQTVITYQNIPDPVTPVESTADEQGEEEVSGAWQRVIWMMIGAIAILLIGGVIFVIFTTVQNEQTRVANAEATDLAKTVTPIPLFGADTASQNVPQIVETEVMAENSEATPEPVIAAAEPTSFLTNTPEVANPATSTPEALPAVVITATPNFIQPVEINGAQDFLSTLREGSFASEVFVPVDTGSWLLGTANQGTGDVISIQPSQEEFDEIYSSGASNRIASVEAEITLQTTIPAIVPEDDVYFGLLLLSVDDQKQTGVEVQAITPTVINVREVIDEQTQSITQQSVDTITVSLRLERDPVSGNVALMVNDGFVGQSIPFVPPDAAVVPVIYVRDGGVIVNVSRWWVTLR